MVIFISAKFLKIATEVISAVRENVINVCFDAVFIEFFSLNLKTPKVVPVYKNGDKNQFYTLQTNFYISFYFQNS